MRARSSSAGSPPGLRRGLGVGLRERARDRLAQDRAQHRDHVGRLCHHNGANPAGIGVWPSNNLDGWRMSAAITHLNPRRHCLNLTVRGNVFVRRVLFTEKKAVGVEVESGGELFTVEAARVVLSAGAIKSPIS